MKSTVETLEETRIKLTVEVGLDELKPSIDHAYKHIAEQVNVPGFRKGKVPARIIDQRVGRPAVLEHAINDALPNLYRQAVAEADIKPIGQPQVDVTAVPGVTEDAEELVFTAEVSVRPEIELPDLSEITLEVESSQVTDADIDEQLETLRKRFGTLVGVERAAEDGDFLSIDLDAKAGDEQIDTAEGVSYEIGSGNMLEGLDEAVIGLSAGESKTFTTALVGGERAGEDAEVTVTVKNVKEQELPELDDDFAQLASEVDTLEEFKTQLREQLAGNKVNNQAIAARDLLLEKLLEDIEFPLPSAIIEAEVNEHLENESRLEDDTHRAEVTEEATKNLRRQLLLDAIVEKYEVRVEQNELLEFLLRTAQQYQMDPNEFIQQADQAGQIPLYMAELGRNKSLAVALREVSVKDAEGAEVDLTAFIGSDEEDTDASDQLVEEALARAEAAAAAEDSDEDTDTK